MTIEIKDEELKVIYSALDDQRRLIAAGKVQRWDVVKWGITVNTGLAVVAAAIPFKGTLDLCGLAVPLSFIPSLLAGAVALVGFLLVLYYNRRMTEARNDAKHLISQMTEKGIDYNRGVGKDVSSHYEKGALYDFQELILFTIILICVGVFAPPACFLAQAADWGGVTIRRICRWSRLSTTAFVLE